MPVYDLDVAGNYVLGAGRLFVADPGDDSWHYLAQTADMNFAIEVERVLLDDVDDAIAEELCNVATKITRTLTTNFRDINRQTLTKFFAGTASDVVEAGSGPHTESFTAVELGTFAQLGEGTGGAPNPPAYGIRGVSAVSAVRDPGGIPVALVVGDDFDFDPVEGLIQWRSGGTNLLEGDAVDVTYTVDATTTEVIATGANASTTLKAKFVADNTKGINRTYFMPAIDMAGAGDFALKSRSDFQQIPVEIKVLDNGIDPALSILGPPV